MLPRAMRDRLLRAGELSFALIRAVERLADPEVAKSLSLAYVFDWYQDCPEQIERAVITGGVAFQVVLLASIR
jgi:hypothetical protein